MTMQLRSEWDKEMETTQRQVSKYLKIADRVAKQVITG